MVSYQKTVSTSSTGKKDSVKKLEKLLFPKHLFSALTPQLTPRVFWTAPFCVKKLEKSRYSCWIPGIFMVAEAGLEPTTSGLWGVDQIAIVHHFPFLYWFRQVLYHKKFRISKPMWTDLSGLGSNWGQNIVRSPKYLHQNAFDNTFRSRHWICLPRHHLNRLRFGRGIHGKPCQITIQMPIATKLLLFSESRYDDRYAKSSPNGMNPFNLEVFLFVCCFAQNVFWIYANTHFSSWSNRKSVSQTKTSTAIPWSHIRQKTGSNFRWTI